MTVIIFSLISALCFAFHAIWIKYGLKESDPLTATLISSSINVGFLWILTLSLVPIRSFLNEGLIYLVIGGLLAPSLARAFLYTGFERVGVSITSPIRSLFPLISGILAIVFLNEPFTLPIGIAVLFTVSGTALLSSSSSGSNTPLEFRWKKKDLLFPFTAAILYGVSLFVRKIGMVTIGFALTAATIVTTTSLITYLLSLPLMRKKRKMTIGKRSVLYFALGGIAGSFGQIFMMSALRTGKVTIVTPLVGTTPIFVLFMTYFFLRKSERLNAAVVVGAIAIVTGIVILATLA